MLSQEPQNPQSPKYKALKSKPNPKKKYLYTYTHEGEDLAQQNLEDYEDESFYSPRSGRARHTFTKRRRDAGFF
jgi:hypothetical protein